MGSLDVERYEEGRWMDGHWVGDSSMLTCLSRSIISVHHEQRGEEREVGSGRDVM